MKRIITILLSVLLLLGLALPMASAVSFSDVPAGEWFVPYVEWVSENGVMQGTGGGNFSPNQPMTRGQLVTMLWRMVGEPSASGNHFVDVASGRFYTTAVYWAADVGITQGVSENRFAPYENITREQFATFLHRFADTPTANTPSHWSNFSDRGLNAPFADMALRWATYHGIVTGTSATTLSPQGMATRAQGAAMLMRFDGLGGTVPSPSPSPSPSPTPTPPVTTPAHEFELEVLRLINVERASAGLSLFVWDDSLWAVARAHSVDMATRGFFSHTCPSGVTTSDRINNGTRWSSGGECLAFGDTPSAAVQAWMNSPGHRAILLNDWGAPWTHFAGIGYYNQRFTLKTTMGTY